MGSRTSSCKLRRQSPVFFLTKVSQSRYLIRTAIIGLALCLGAGCAIGGSLTATGLAGERGWAVAVAAGLDSKGMFLVLSESVVRQMMKGPCVCYDRCFLVGSTCIMFSVFA